VSRPFPKGGFLLAPQFENDIRAERQSDGIAKAKEKGVPFSRKRALSVDQRQRIRTLREVEKFSAPKKLAKRFNVGPATIYRALQEP
jgi:DNA invertase Pin-like site-specific DNA recombinase